MSSDHNHSRFQVNSLSRLLIAIFINSGIVIFEIILGVITGSMALISDAIHNISDISAMILGFWSEKIAKKPANKKKTYGYKKIEFVTAFANSIVLSVAIVFVFYEAVMRFFEPVEVQSKTMFFVALIALVGNSVATLVLQKTASENFNLKVVWLRSLQDTLLSLGVVVVSIIIYFTNWNFFDPLVSIIICLFIAREIYKIISHTVNALLDSLPEGIDFNEVKNEILKNKDVKEVADLHIWQTDSHTKMLSTHLRVVPESNTKTILEALKNVLHDKFEIEHTTLQIIPFDEPFSNCNHCN